MYVYVLRIKCYTFLANVWRDRLNSEHHELCCSRSIEKTIRPILLLKMAYRAGYVLVLVPSLLFYQDLSL